jgi:hyperosmotically inducible periplasmic protein
MKQRVISKLVGLCVLMAPAVFGADNKAPQKKESSIQREVRHELATLSRYTVFDNIRYRVDGAQVTLMGQVTQPVLKDDAESAVKGIEGVTGVNDQIEVLPLSPLDDQTRRAVFRAIYDNEELNRYQLAPSIHIIVKNGDVTLEGAVLNEMDKDIANIQANQVPGVFHVTNNLQIDTNL